MSGQNTRLLLLKYLRCARGPQDAGNEYGTGSSTQRHRPQALRHEGVPPSRWESSGVSHRPGAPVQSDPLPAPCPERGQVWSGSGRRAIAHIRLDAQPANPHFRRLSVCSCISGPLNSGECALARTGPWTRRCLDLPEAVKTRECLANRANTAATITGQHAPQRHALTPNLQVHDSHGVFVLIPLLGGHTSACVSPILVLLLIIEHLMAR